MNDPVAIDNVTAPGGGRIGLVHCPGTGGLGMLPGDDSAALVQDLAVLRSWGARALVTLLQPYEITMLGMEHLEQKTLAAGLQWWHLPITDGCAPGRGFESGWATAGPALHAILDAGDRLVVHCRAGLGRSGTIAALLLIERGVEAQQAVTAVRRARPGAIENPEQMQWIRSVAAR